MLVTYCNINIWICKCRVAQAYLNEKKLDSEARLLQQNAANFAKQAQQWLQLVENFSSALKEVGDVENWAKSIEKDLRMAETALEYAYKVGPSSNNSWLMYYFVFSIHCIFK